MDDTTKFLLVGGLAVAGYYLYTQSQSASAATTPGIPVYSTTATPYSVYPSMNYSGSAAPSAKALPPVASNSYASAQAQAALQAQCAGSFPGCTPMMSDQSIALGL